MSHNGVTMGSVSHNGVTMGSVPHYGVTMGSVSHYGVTMGSVSHYGVEEWGQCPIMGWRNGVGVTLWGGVMGLGSLRVPMGWSYGVEIPWGAIGVELWGRGPIGYQ